MTSQQSMSHENWLELATAACDHAGVEPGTIEVLRTWEHHQNTVCRLDGQRYLKIYRHNAERQFPVERCVLSILERGVIPAPRLISASDLAGLPPYIIVTAVDGLATEHAWERLSRTEQLSAAREFGDVTAAFHRLAHGNLIAVERQVGGVRESIQFEREQRLAELEQAASLSGRRRTLYSSFPSNRDALCRFVQVESNDYFAGPLCLGHCDLSNGHLFVSQTAGVWRFSGVIDWADAMLVPALWDLSFMWFWAFSCDGEAMKECLRGYYADTRRPERFARGCFAALLHGYSWPALWDSRRDDFARRGPSSEPLDRQLIEYLFPTDVFGPAD